MTEFAMAWSKYLSDSHRNALFSALTILSDEFFNNDLEEEHHIFRDLLPRKYIYRYTPIFLKNFYATILTVGYKLSLPEPRNALIACTAEELALHILIERASAILEMDGIDAEFGAFEEVIYQDLDFEFLYAPEYDGIDDSNLGTELGIGNLRFSEWFKPFRNASMPIHPLCRNEEPNET